MSDLLRSLDRHARTRPEALAIRDVDDSEAERSLNWRQLRDAAFLHSKRLGRMEGPGVVMISAPNRVENVVAILGGLWAGAAVLPVSPEMQPAELLDVARRASVTAFVGTAPASEALSGIVAERIPLESLELDARLQPGEPRLSGGGSILLQSSGTTGVPKIVQRRAAALDAVGESSRRAIGIRENDIMLICLPLCHSYGIDQGVLTAVMAGCAIELHGGFQPALVRSALATRPITILPAVPVMFDALSRTAGGVAPRHALRRALSAGSPLLRRVFDQFLRVFGVKIGQIYGSTEFGPVTYNDPTDDDFDPETVGRPMRGVEIRILDASDPNIDRPLSTGAEGQVAMASPTMLSEYVDDPASPTSEGFLLTGDLGRLDEHGCLHLNGRVKLLIDVGGRKVNPLEVESVLTDHRAVSDAVVVAMPFSDTVHRLKAIVVPKPGHQLDGDELKRFARARLSPHKVPRSFEIRTELPQSPAGKILRSELGSSEGG
jgi:acyl-CoA synthetase (AMP-forming)/AMP-acid ligase II